MEVMLLTVGKTTIPFVTAGIEEYTRRLRHYLPYSIKAIADIRKAGQMDKERQKEEEGKRILESVAAGDYLVLLDERGREYTSVEFAAYMEKQMAAGRKRMVFVVGGPYGFSPAVYARADAKISLSKMTFNHEMVRLFFTEQLYRAMTILRGEPYHHE